ncbi:hypothetical protein FNAPI_13495 [Fusarium napiforme]|uniref:Uncharacterized protein n=1 Tax=Fusarium napiforme TaxID=42672 RepID=A0A8H5IAA0_9HYPO|nr:hypothetical protein FNAPI_13495 [Fusarium napiforme]
MSLPTNKNPFTSVGKWTQALVDQLDIEIDDIKETTSDFTRKKYPKNRYWKAQIKFKHGQYGIKIVKMNDCDVPYIKSATYGTKYILARLQKVVGDTIAAKALEKDIIVSLQDKRAVSDENNWWVTINNTNGRIGIIDSHGNFDPKDAGAVFAKTEQGMKLNIDLVFSIKLTITDGRDRTTKDAFTLVADCSRGAIQAIRQDIEPPAVEATIPQQAASKSDIASQELCDALDSLML